MCATNFNSSLALGEISKVAMFITLLRRSGSPDSIGAPAQAIGVAQQVPDAVADDVILLLGAAIVQYPQFLELFFEVFQLLAARLLTRVKFLRCDAAQFFHQLVAFGLFIRSIVLRQQVTGLLIVAVADLNY